MSCGEQGEIVSEWKMRWRVSIFLEDEAANEHLVHVDGCENIRSWIFASPK